MDTYTCIYTYTNGRHGRKSSSSMTHVAIHPHGTCTNEASISLPFQASKPLPSSNTYRRYLATFLLDLPKARTVVPYTFSACNSFSASSPLSITSPSIPEFNRQTYLAISVRQLTSPFLPSLFSNRQDKIRQKRKGPKSKPESGLTTPSNSTNGESRLSIWGWTCRTWDGSSYQQQV